MYRMSNDITCTVCLCFMVSVCLMILTCTVCLCFMYGIGMSNDINMYSLSVLYGIGMSNGITCTVCALCMVSVCVMV